MSRYVQWKYMRRIWRLTLSEWLNDSWKRQQNLSAFGIGLNENFNIFSSVILLQESFAQFKFIVETQ